jgi:hypothetical protein
MSSTVAEVQSQLPVPAGDLPLSDHLFLQKGQALHSPSGRQSPHRRPGPQRGGAKLKDMAVGSVAELG